MPESRDMDENKKKKNSKVILELPDVSENRQVIREIIRIGQKEQDSV